jgi:uncharacterized protein YjiK
LSRAAPSSRIAAAWLLLLTTCSPPASSAQESAIHALPADLREVSGLALASPMSVFAHDDERAVIHEIALSSGRTLRRFSFGAPPVGRDFEGIATDGESIFLITSGGELLTGRIGSDGESMRFDVQDTGIGAACEIEGLSRSPDPGSLLVLCKRTLRDRPGPRLVIHRWDVRRRVAQGPWLELDLEQALSGGRRSFSPSGIEWDAARRQLLIISARDGRLVVLDEEGGIRAVQTLSSAAHRQAEGIAITPAGELVIADEAGRAGSGRLTVYPADYLRQVLSRLPDTSSGERTAEKNSSR